MLLFNRTTRSVWLTDAGRDFAARIAPALAEIQTALDQASAQRETPSGRLRINAAAQGARAIGPLVLAGAGIGYFIEEGVAEDIAAGRLVRAP